MLAVTYRYQQYLKFYRCFGDHRVITLNHEIPVKWVLLLCNYTYIMFNWDLLYPVTYQLYVKFPHRGVPRSLQRFLIYDREQVWSEDMGSAVLFLFLALAVCPKRCYAHEVCQLLQLNLPKAAFSVEFCIFRFPIPWESWYCCWGPSLMQWSLRVGKAAVASFGSGAEYLFPTCTLLEVLPVPQISQQNISYRFYYGLGPLMLHSVKF